MKDAPKRRRVESLLRQRITSGLHLGLLKPGDRLPSARELHLELRADPRVIAAAYHRLARDGLVALRARARAHVAIPAAAGRPLPAPTKWVIDVLLQGLAQGIPIPEFGRRIEGLVAPGTLRAACIECNTDQLSSLQEELEHGYGFATVGVELDQLSTDGVQDDLRAVDLLVTTSFHADTVRELALRLARPWLAVSLHSDTMMETAARLREGPVYFVGTDPRFATKVVEIFQPTGLSGNVRPIILGRDSLEMIPAGAPVVIMRRAMPLLAGTELIARARLPDRIFSNESARELLAFIIRKNAAALQDGLSPALP